MISVPWLILLVLGKKKTKRYGDATSLCIIAYHLERIHCSSQIYGENAVEEKEFMKAVFLPSRTNSVRHMENSIDGCDVLHSIVWCILHLRVLTLAYPCSSLSSCSTGVTYAQKEMVLSRNSFNL